MVGQRWGETGVAKEFYLERAPHLHRSLNLIISSFFFMHRRFLLLSIVGVVRELASRLRAHWVARKKMVH